MVDGFNTILASGNPPMMALRGLTIFPNMVVNFDVERQKSKNSLKLATDGDCLIFLTAQKNIAIEDPKENELYEIGTLCVVRQFLKTQAGTLRVMIEGKYRARMLKHIDKGDHARAEIEIITPDAPGKKTARIEALMRQAITLYDEYLSLSGNENPEVIVGLTMREEPGYVADYITQNIYLKHNKKQEILETIDSVKRLKSVCKILAREIEVLAIERNINDKLHEQLARVQKDNILREQMKVIQTELGEGDSFSEITEYREKIEALKLSEEITEKLLKETDRLGKQPYNSSEAALIRAYLDVCIELPWNKSTKERVNIDAARKILDNDHFGLDKVKERIIELLAVKQLAPDIKGTILCLVGPPGVGKTSIAISVAKATNRKLARMSLGGVHDEAEIRGHRKTYVGSMPGRIMSAINQAGSKNPLLLLDEIDKMGSDYRGDPAAALLEALDPEQNKSFRDHYLELPFDLSDVLFITTANTTDTIPRPLLDRMEIITLNSYTDEEKLQIAKRHLLPKQLKKHGLNNRRLKMNDDVIREIISGYTKESGVRQLERELAHICRKVATKIVAGEGKTITVKTGALEGFLGVRKYDVEDMSNKEEVGIVNGLAWTSTGGELLEVEVSILEGTGKLELTGNLGDVMKESARAAVSYIRSRADTLGIDSEFYKNRDIHIHFPEGAIPKDGPSAGIAITVAVISALTGAPVKKSLAMTGEITLSGRVLAIGGLKEKTMAALRSGVKTVIIPEKNECDLEEIDQTVRRSLNFVTASNIDNILNVALDFTKIHRESKTNDKFSTELLSSDSKAGSISITQ